MIHRRALLTATGALLLAPGARAAPATASVPASGHLAFKALRNDSDLGTHDLTFTRDGDDLAVAIAVDYVVKFGPIAVFRYRLRTTEHWHAGSFVSLHSEVDDNGTSGTTNITRDGGTLKVAGRKTGAYDAPGNALPASHWNPAELNGPMINPDTGELMPFTTSALGAQPIKSANGTEIPAHRFALRGPDTIDLWYDDSTVWCGLRAVIRKDQSVVTYERI